MKLFFAFLYLFMGFSAFGQNARVDPIPTEISRRKVHLLRAQRGQAPLPAIGTVIAPGLVVVPLAEPMGVIEESETHEVLTVLAVTKSSGIAWMRSTTVGQNVPRLSLPQMIIVTLGAALKIPGNQGWESATITGVAGGFLQIDTPHPFDLAGAPVYDQNNQFAGMVIGQLIAFSGTSAQGSFAPAIVTAPPDFRASDA